jgi:hypothetical protein
MGESTGKVGTEPGNVDNGPEKNTEELVSSSHGIAPFEFSMRLLTNACIYIPIVTLKRYNPNRRGSNVVS